MILIDPLSVVHPDTKIAADVKIGPYTVVSSGVQIESGTVLHSHVVIKGNTYIGKNNRIFQFASVGEDCQDLKYSGESTKLVIGDNNTIREGCTIHRGTVQDKGVTKIGNDNLFMAYVHVAHDCIIGNHCILSNNASLAGHVEIDDHAILGGFAAVHQHCKIGPYSMIRACSALFKDLPAFVMASGNPAKATGMNYEGMRRKGWSSEIINSLKSAYKIIYRQGRKIDDAVAMLEDMSKEAPQISLLIDTIKNSTRGIIR